MFRSILFALLALVLVSACSSTAASESESNGVTVTAGTWSMVDSDDTLNMEAIVKDDNIVITWITDNTSSLYWKGSFPKTAQDDEDIVSKGDTEEMAQSLLGSQDDKKTFTISDGVLSFPMTVMGTTRVIKLEQS